jgi:oligoribonuclease NrnB/cAMP/cGMP phosphodiesterase (DHH superfamily)
MTTLVIYHGGGCFDGFCAAWVLHKRFPDAEFVAARYGEPPPHHSRLSGKAVIIADFSYKRDVLAGMSQVCNSITVLDHHKTAEAELGGLTLPGLSVTFDMNKSGGRLAWEYIQLGTPSPWLVDYTEDRDLWRWALPDSKAVNANLRTYAMDFETWDYLEFMGDKAFRAFVGQGDAILRCERQVIDQHVRNAREIDIAGYRVKAVNATTLFSEIAGELAEGGPFGACYFDRGDGKRQWSLRSRDGGVDVSEVAKRFGGGGHRNAAGFEQPIPGA